MSDHHDLDWLAALQPAPLAPDADAARSARKGLMLHVAGRRAPLALVRPTAPVRRAPERRWIRPSRILALTAVATTAAVAALAIGGGGGGGGHVVGVDQAAAAPLVQLSRSVQRSVAQPGDATLILRTQHVTGQPAFSGADLYLDNGHYYYSETLAGLPAAIAAGDTGGDALWIKRYLSAAVGALHEDADSGRAAMAIANLDPTQSAQDRAANENAALAEKEAARAKLVQEGKIPPAHTPLTPEEHTNGMIWSNALQAMLAGGSRPDVRAGVLKLLATIPAVTVTPGTSDGHATLELNGPVLSGYAEHLVIDAESGLPLHLTGGDVGKAPTVVVTYTVTRVTAAEIAGG
ncbi:MAG TPA: hypothetical protein VGK92_07895 [Gaiellales bacterium]